MDNKKKIIIAVIIVVLIALVLGGYKIATSYLFTSNGKITDGKVEVIEHLKSIEDTSERKKQIDYSVEQNIITQEEANKLY